MAGEEGFTGGVVRVLLYFVLKSPHAEVASNFLVRGHHWIPLSSFLYTTQLSEAQHRHG